MSGCGVALRRGLLRRLRLGLLVALRLALGLAFRLGLALALLVGARAAVVGGLLSLAAVGLVPAGALEHDRRRRQEAPWPLPAARALLERVVIERLHRREHVTTVIAAVVVDRHRSISSPKVSGGAIAIDERAASRRRRGLIENAQAYMFLVPAIAFLGLFKVLPAFYAVYISLFRWDVIQGAFRGLDNYFDILWQSSTRSQAFWQSLSTTFTYAAITVPIEIALALVVAYVLFQKLRGRDIYRTIYYLPYVTSTVAAATVFSWVFHPQYGIANQLLGVFGISGLRWYQEPDGVFQMFGNALGLAVPDWAAGPSLALVGVAIFSIWHFLGFQILIFLGGLGNIPVEYYEAAKLDGANQWQLFRRITLPLLSPQIFFVFTIASIGVLRAFNEIFILTNGGPLDSTRTVTMLLFRTFFQQGQIGLGSAMGVLLTLIILAFTLIQFGVLERRVTYT